MAELRVEGLTKAFGETAVVRDVSFTVSSGQFFALLGPSGSGKTTILRMISGFVAPDSGRVLVDGEDVTALAPERRQMGVVFQNYALFPHMTVWHNIAFGLDVRRVGAADKARRIRDALRLVHLEGFERRRPAELSGGQQQRVALARALVVEPRLLLLDEPLSALDARIRVEMRAELRRIQRESGVTAVIVTHDQEEAMELADALLVLDGGRVVQSGTPREVYTRPESDRVAAFMGRTNEFDAVVRSTPEGLVAELAEGVAWRLGANAGARAAGTGQAWPARVAFRPERVRLVRATPSPAGGRGPNVGADPGGPEARPTDGIILEGSVVAVRFDGPVSRVEVAAGTLRAECLVLSREAEELSVGERVRLWVPAADIQVFAR
ncbi:MAG: ABC transporter ATP-binding protein [Firmicutes bacterium]|nr:ABC transporter ATP-binding protein [Bacillota bacterium]